MDKKNFFGGIKSYCPKPVKRIFGSYSCNQWGIDFFFYRCNYLIIYSPLFDKVFPPYVEVEEKIMSCQVKFLNLISIIFI
jgi:hypothetical protein